MFLDSLGCHFPEKCWFKLRNSLKHAVFATNQARKGRKTAIFSGPRATAGQAGLACRIAPVMTGYNASSPLFSPRGAAKCVRGQSVRGARRLTRGGVLDSKGEHGEQAQRSNGGPLAYFDRQVVRNAG